MTTPVLKVENLVKKFGFWHPQEIVKGISFEIHAGQIVALMGGNGAGKSTTFDMLSGLSKPTNGTISLYQSEEDSWRDVTNEPLFKRAQRGISYLPQNPSLFTQLTVRQNLLGMMELMKKKDLITNMEAYDSSLVSMEDFCDSLLEKFDLLKRAKENVSALSGGERRRLAIARALIRKTKLLILDEPYAALDIKGIELCHETFFRVRDMGVAILIVDHHVKEILEISDQVIFLKTGNIHSIGAPEEIVYIPVFQDEILSGKTEEVLSMFAGKKGVSRKNRDFDSPMPEMFKSKSVRME